MQQIAAGAAAAIVSVAGAVAIRAPSASNWRVQPGFSGRTAKVLSKDEELFVEGEPADLYYKVVSGVVRTYKLLDDGRRQIDAFHLAGDIFGLESGTLHRFSADAVGAASVVAYRRDDVDTVIARDPAMGRQIVAATMRSLERAQDHMLLLGRKTAQEKVASFLLDMIGRMRCRDHFDLPMQRTDIADYLGLTIETVSRTLSQFARNGHIELAVCGRSVVVRDMAALERLHG